MTVFPVFSGDLLLVWSFKCIFYCFLSGGGGFTCFIFKGWEYQTVGHIPRVPVLNWGNFGPKYANHPCGLGCSFPTVTSNRALSWDHPCQKRGHHSGHGSLRGACDTYQVPRGYNWKGLGKMVALPASCFSNKIWHRCSRQCGGFGLEDSGTCSKFSKYNICKYHACHRVLIGFCSLKCIHHWVEN